MHGGRRRISGGPPEGACVKFTNVVKCGEDAVKPRRIKAKWESGMKMKAQSTAQVRATISFPAEVYETLEVIAKEKKVSLAWVVREAAEKYLAAKWPLFPGQDDER
jgi:hypothetical protein